MYEISIHHDCLLQLHDDDNDRSRVLGRARCHVTREKATDGVGYICNDLTCGVVLRQTTTLTAGS